jgi:NADH-quinone oxidoreductase subunit D
MPLKVVTRSVEETRALGEQLGRDVLRPGDVVVLSGELGTGKTALAQGVGRGLEVDAPVVSPTFTLVREYQGPSVRLCHVDIYRLEKVQELHELGIEEQITERATTIRVLMTELNRISSHLVWLATTGMELGAISMMLYGFREREYILDIFEETSGLRMNHAYIRPGGVAHDIPPGAIDTIRESLVLVRHYFKELEDLMMANPILHLRLKDVGYLGLSGCMALGVTGPVLRSAGLPYDVRKANPYCGYETYDFDVPVTDTADSWGRLVLRVEECYQSMKIVEQTLDRLQKMGPGPVMVEDKKVAWPAQMAIGSDGMGNSLDHIREIMGTSMEALIHHFKLVTEGFRVPAGQVFQTVEHPRGELGVHLVSDGGTRPYRAHFRDPSFNNLQATSIMCEGGQVADVVVAVASLDPVLGGVDR